MANPAGRKGYAGEAPVVEFLRRAGFHRVYRMRNQGTADKGDVGGIDKVCIEIKNVSTYAFPKWMSETRREKANARAETSALVVKPRGVGASKVAEWWVMMTLEEYTDLLKRAGYGPIEGTP